MKYKILLFVVFTFLKVFPILAQGPKVSTVSKKAMDHYQKGNEYLDTRRFPDAIEQFEKAVAIDSNFVEAHSVLAELYVDTKKLQKAIISYKAAIRSDPEFYPQNYVNLARAEMHLEKFDDAVSHIQKSLTYEKLPPNVRKKALALLSNATFAAEAVKRPVAFIPVNLGDSINGSFWEYCAGVTADDQQMFFIRLLPNKNPQRQGRYGTADLQEDIYESHRENGVWTEAQSVGSTINTFDNEGALCISADGKTLLYTVCNNPYDYGRCDIYMVNRYGDLWGKPKNIGPAINTKYIETQPSLSADGLTIYFASDRLGGFGKMDLWKSSLKPDGEWDVPVNLGPTINTPEVEQSPFIHSDNKSLYYTSNGLPGIGDQDLYVSRKNGLGVWTTPVNLGYPLNTISEERNLVINATGTTGYIASDRLNGKGKMDLYSFPLPESIRPSKVHYVKGKVYNSDTKEPVQSRFELMDIATSEIAAVAYSDKVSGEFLVCLPTDKDYALNVSKPGYLFYSENFSLKANNDVKDAMKMDVPLKTIKIGRGVVLKNIFFNTNSYELMEQSKAELQKLIAFLNANPKVTIEIGGHTDDVGNDQSNQVLSANRAKTVLEYLIAAHIPKERLTSKGFGESKPIATNKTEEGKALNRRTEFIVTGL